MKGWVLSQEGDKWSVKLGSFCRVCRPGFVMLILSTMLMFGCGFSWLLVFVSPGLVMRVSLRVVP